MTDAPEFKIEGLSTLVRTMKRAGVDIQELKDAHHKAGQIVATEAAHRAPRVSGKLAGSVKSARQARRARITAGRAAVPYAAPIHWGWPARGIEANPFVSEAAQATESRWLDQYLRDVQHALDHVRGV